MDALSIVTTTVYEVTCLLCGRVAATIVDLHAYRGPACCPHCGGTLQAEPCSELPRNLGIDVSKHEPLPARYEREEPWPEKQCLDCGTPTIKAERCRRCYLRHRYATNPAVRAKQLRLQQAWRQRQGLQRKGAVG